jgi:hypothetical protein
MSSAHLAELANCFVIDGVACTVETLGNGNGGGNGHMTIRLKGDHHDCREISDTGRPAVSP